ncbi:hypothetical protein RYZ26_18025 [Terasakiella sp. A23]|uniref:hypothetical protein n=1 Tax=Terasakiella sp. FCG-A23 TaxID=3080561 RepID=UPI00295324FA|nr:hypothetical protein [Terasakiella sp. A23]MDV7341513.1 hypothetical protein [Terasakiella sp. A23]
MLRKETLLALGYCLLSLLTSIGAAYHEGTLLDPVKISYQGRDLVLHPYIHNFSTLIDFALLNPLAIFFILRARRHRVTVSEKVSKSLGVSTYHYIGISILCALLAFMAMRFYVGGFLVGDYFSETIGLGPDNKPFITITGWIVFTWTWLFIAVLFWGCAEQGIHVFDIVRWNKDDIQYHPFDSDEAGGQKFLMVPSLHFTYAMISVLMIFVVFYVQDSVAQIEESNRLWGFGIYLLIVGPLFSIPFMKIHRLMYAHRKQILKKAYDVLDPKDEKSADDPVNHYLKVAERYKALAESLPVWPLSWKNYGLPVASLVSASVPIIKKMGISLLPMMKTLVG